MKMKKIYTQNLIGTAKCPPSLLVANNFLFGAAKVNNLFNFSQNYILRILDNFHDGKISALLMVELRNQLFNSQILVALAENWDDCKIFILNVLTPLFHRFRFDIKVLLKRQFLYLIVFLLFSNSRRIRNWKH